MGAPPNWKGNRKSDEGEKTATAIGGGSEAKNKGRRKSNSELQQFTRKGKPHREKTRPKGTAIG